MKIISRQSAFSFCALNEFHTYITRHSLSHDFSLLAPRNLFSVVPIQAPSSNLFKLPFPEMFIFQIHPALFSFLPIQIKSYFTISQPPKATVDNLIILLADFILGGSKIAADGDCSHEIKICLLFGRKVMTNLDSIFKNRDITLSTKVCLVKAMVFPVVIYGCESWTIKKAEHGRIDAF